MKTLSVFVCVLFVASAKADGTGHSSSSPSSFTKIQGEDSHTQIMLKAAAAGDWEAVARMMGVWQEFSPGDLDSRSSKTGMTLLHYLAEGVTQDKITPERTELFLRFFIQRGANSNIKDDFGRTPRQILIQALNKGLNSRDDKTYAIRKNCQAADSLIERLSVQAKLETATNGHVDGRRQTP